MEPFEPFRYIRYVRSRWRFLALSLVVAIAAAVAITALQRPRYTAVARILIEPPPGADPRSAMTVSPIYFESLKTYESFAASDSLFQEAIDRFRLRSLLGGLPFESLKKSVLKVQMVRNTRILEISATLPEAARAHALAQFVAERTVALSRSLTGDGDSAHYAGFSMEQLTIIDPGVVPERPSSPNFMLNLVAALVLGFLLPLAWLAIELNWSEQRVLESLAHHD